MSEKSACAVDGCLRSQRARGYCNLHYLRWRRHGDPLTVIKARSSRTATAAERLSRVGWTVADSGCWEWNGHSSHNGYGQVAVAGHTLRAHRVAYETWVGPIPEGLVVRHSCDNRSCINPRHLDVGTQLENIRDMVERGRARTGEKNVGAKLTWSQVREIRSLASANTEAELARRFGVSKTAIHCVISNQTWREPQERGAA